MAIYLTFETISLDILYWGNIALSSLESNSHQE